MKTELKPEDGWNHWIWGAPPDVLIQVNREGWHSPSVLYPKDVHPEANINGLYWRLTGIGKEELRRIL